MSPQPPPQPGQRWRRTVDATVVGLLPGGWIEFRRDDGDCETAHPMFGTWERLPDPEPEWQPGDLVLDINGRVWQRRPTKVVGDDVYVWAIPGRLNAHIVDASLDRPLRRLVVTE